MDKLSLYPNDRENANGPLSPVWRAPLVRGGSDSLAADYCDALPVYSPAAGVAFFLLQDGEIIGRGPCGEVFMLLTIDPHVFRRLEEAGAAEQDDENNNDAEAETEDEIVSGCASGRPGASDDDEDDDGIISRSLVMPAPSGEPEFDRSVRQAQAEIDAMPPLEFRPPPGARPVFVPIEQGRAAA